MKYFTRKLVFFYISVIGLAATQSACHSLTKTQKGIAIGAGAGGTIGAAIGKAAGNTALGAIIGGALGGSAGALIGKNMDKQADEIKKTIPGTAVVRQAEGIVIRFDSGILFDPGKADIKPVARENLRSLAASLQKHPSTDILIVGHTDSDGDKNTNMDLSVQRAKSVKSFIIDNGIDSSRLATQGKGDTDPIADNSTAAGREKNRRVELVIMANNQMKDWAKKSNSK